MAAAEIRNPRNASIITTTITTSTSINTITRVVVIARERNPVRVGVGVGARVAAQGVQEVVLRVLRFLKRSPGSVKMRKEKSTMR